MISRWIPAAAFLAASTAFAQDNSSNSARPAAVDDKLFAAAAADGGATEVAMSRLGVQKATHEDLKKFSQKMIDEHTKLNAELQQTAAQKGIALPREVGPCAQFELQSLSGLSGEEFDRCYAAAQLLAHKGAYAAFKAESERGQDPAIKALAEKALPKIKEHLDTIKPIAEKLEK
ncbi:MAG: DUF4142 domain-containing protein [Isosphaeraceae bacterium]